MCVFIYLFPDFPTANKQASYHAYFDWYYVDIVITQMFCFGSESKICSDKQTCHHGRDEAALLAGSLWEWKIFIEKVINENEVQ